jgi:structural maintenance of chromosome 2
LNDKAKIESVIEELDVKKIQSLQKTYDQVNKDFGSIFSMLLPGTTAKLEPLLDCPLMDGLEVKVAFNGVWKDSLTELSGGQRSLLALSLILALLLFKPAPMYILDEVDAALDLSHTQNIGLMIKTHFASSQFIVVSLKEGMFNNANVIYRTKFIDGISAVTRTVSGARAGRGSTFHQQPFLVTNDENVNVENEINSVVNNALTNKKKSSSKVTATGKKSSSTEDDEEDDDDAFELVPAKKRGKAVK